MKIIFLSILLPFTLLSFSQSAKDFKFQTFSIKDGSEVIDFYIYSEDSILSKKPIFLYLQGSGPNSIFSKDNNGEISQSFILPPKMVSKNYHFVIIGKPGTPFINDEKKSKIDSLKYHSKTSLDNRVERADFVLKYLINQTFVDNKKVVVFGHSEGAQIAPKLADKNKSITHLACFSGTGINQMYDFITHARKEVKSKDLSIAEADKEIDSLLYYYKDIINNPNSIDKFWSGHTYLRWYTTIMNPPLDYLVKINIPIYIVAGTEDNASPIENMDNIPIEFIKRGKTNLTYKYYWNLDHVYNDVVLQENKMKNVFIDFLEWLKKK